MSHGKAELSHDGRAKLSRSTERRPLLDSEVNHLESGKQIVLSRSVAQLRLILAGFDQLSSEAGQTL